MYFSEKLSIPLVHSPFFARPLFLLSAVFLISLFLIEVSFIGFAVFFAGAAVWCVVAVSKEKKIYRAVKPLPLLMILFLLSGALLGASLIPSQKRAKEYDGKTVTAVGTVMEVYYTENYGSAFLVDLKEIDGRKCDFSALLETEGDFEFPPYCEIVFTAEVSYTLDDVGGGDLLTAKSEKRYAELSAVSIERFSPPKKSFANSVYEMRMRAGERFGILKTAPAGFAKAILIGDRSGLNGYFYRDMTALGITHILAVSGLHTTVIASFVMILLSKLKAGRKISAALVSVVGLFYVAFAGFSYSVTRAVIMLIFSVVPFFFGRKGDSLTALGVSGVIICLISPEAVVSCSFLLSFSASLGIILCAGAVNQRAEKFSRAGDMKKFYKAIYRFVGTLIVTLSASLFTVPVIALYYKEISVVALLANIVAIPCATASVILALLILIFGKIPVVSKVLCLAFEGIYRLLSSFAGYVSSHFVTTVSLDHDYFIVILILFFCSLLYMRLRRVKDPALLFVPLLVCTVIFTACFQTEAVMIKDRREVIYTAGERSECFILSNGSKVMYVDIGDGSKGLQFYAKENAFDEYSTVRIDGYMLTHYHSRHISTLKRLLMETYIGTLYLPYPETENEISFCSSILSFTAGHDVVMYSRGDTVTFGCFEIETLPYTLLERSGHPIMALKFTAGERSLVYLGSSVAESENFAETVRLADGCGFFVLGSHGPVTKETGILFGSESADVWCSPYEDTDEKTLFTNGSFHYLAPDAEGYSSAKFAF